MKKSPFKLKGFTIIELMVTMILTGVVVSIGYAAFRLTSSQFNKLKDSFYNSNEFISLNTALLTDFDKAKKISLIEHGIYCELETNFINYKFQPSMVIRNLDDMVIDTFKLEVLTAQYHFETTIQNTTDGIIDHLFLELKNNSDTLLIHLTKRYDSRVLFNNSQK